MPTYAIGDVQGCIDPLMRLLDHIHFDPAWDTLWFTGDIVNRGPDSVGVLRFIHALGSRHRTVLGNHDLHLLAVASGAHDGFSGDTLQNVLDAADCDVLLDWLCAQPLLYHDSQAGFVMTHAGIPPLWDLAMAKRLAAEVSDALADERRQGYLQHLYGNQPDQWQSTLTGWDRLRCITNHFTRMRRCFLDGRLLHASDTQSETLPWFEFKNRPAANERIVFGHWAELSGITHVKNVFALDTGCVWGFSLSALCLETGERFTVPARA